MVSGSVSFGSGDSEGEGGVVDAFDFVVGKGGIAGSFAFVRGISGDVNPSVVSVVSRRVVVLLAFIDILFDSVAVVMDEVPVFELEPAACSNSSILSFNCFIYITVCSNTYTSARPPDQDIGQT